MRIPDEFESCDPHVTAYLGREKQRVLLHAHLYVAYQPPAHDGGVPLSPWSVVPYQPMALEDRTPPEELTNSKTWRPRNPDLWKHDHNGSIAQAVRAQELRKMPTWRKPRK